MSTAYKSAPTHNEDDIHVASRKNSTAACLMDCLPAYIYILIHTLLGKGVLSSRDSYFSDGLVDRVRIHVLQD